MPTRAFIEARWAAKGGFGLPPLGGGAEETYIVAFDIKDAGPGWNPNGSFKSTELEKLGSAEKASIGGTEYEAGSLYAKEGLKDVVSTCKLVEVAKAESAAEAIEAVRKVYTAAKSTGCRAVVKPNTNFKAVV